MRRLAAHAWDSTDASLMEAVAVLSAGGVVAYPTETFYGLAVDPRDPIAIDGLFAAKGREKSRAIPLIAASLDQLLEVAGDVGGRVRAVAGRFWPGPLTVVIPAWPGLALAIHGSSGTVAVRVSSHPIASGLARAFGHPITSTSANPSGAPPIAEADGVEAALGAAVTLLIDGGRTPGGEPSTIVDLTAAEPRLIRAGAIAWDAVVASLRAGPSS